MKIRQTCAACPTQWEGTLDDGRFVYFRYRHGRLTIDIAKDADSCMYGTGDTTVWFEDFTDERGNDGFMDDDEVKAIIEGALNEKVIVMTGIDWDAIL